MKIWVIKMTHSTVGQANTVVLVGAAEAEVVQLKTAPHVGKHVGKAVVVVAVIVMVVVVNIPSFLQSIPPTPNPY